MVMSNLTFKGFDADMNMLSNTQRFLYASTNPTAKFSIYSLCAPTVLVPSVITPLESLNQRNAGFRFIHTSATTDVGDWGIFKLECFDSTGPQGDLLSITNNSITSSKTFFSNRAYGAINWIGNTMNTPIPTAGAYVKVIGITTLASVSHSAAMSSNNTLRFTPTETTKTIDAEINANITVFWAGATNALLSVSILRDGTTYLPGVASVTSTGANNRYNLSLQTTSSLGNISSLELFVTSDTTDATGITVENGSLSFKAV